jgi:protein SCO1/2
MNNPMTLLMITLVIFLGTLQTTAADHQTMDPVAKPVVIKTSPPDSPKSAPPLPPDSIYQVHSEWLDQNGKKLQLTDLRGMNIVVSMVYLKCQYSCPMTIARMKEVEKALTPEAKAKTRFLLVTFDIKKDTPEILLKYAKKSHLDLSSWTLLTTKTESDVREFSTLIDFKYKSLASGEFEHSYAIIGLDSDGRILGRTEGAEMDPKIIADLINKK